MSEIARFYYPRSEAEALEVLARAPGKIGILAGGTGLPSGALVRLEALADLTRTGLDRIEGTGGEVRIGAVATAQSIWRSRLLREAGAEALAEAGRAAGSRPIRNAVTLGGNVVQCFSWCDLPIPLLALEARVRIAGPRPRTLAFSDLVAKHPRTQFKPGEILAEVTIPVLPWLAGLAYSRFSLTATDWALASAAAYLELRDGKIHLARLALGAVAPVPQRAKAAEEVLEGAEPTEEAFARAARAAREGLKPAPSARASEAYILDLVEALSRRALAEAHRRALARPRPDLPPGAGEGSTSRAKRGDVMGGEGGGERPEVRGIEQPPEQSPPPGPFLEAGAPLEVEIDGRPMRIACRPSEVLLDVLRREGFHGVKRGCDTGDCGACAVLVDGRPMNSCLLLAGQVAGRRVTTIHGIGTLERPHALQRAFAAAGAVQCGYCTPGTIISARALLEENPDPTEEEVREALDGNLCRCTGYVKIVEAVRRAAAMLREGEKSEATSEVKP